MKLRGISMVVLTAVFSLPFATVAEATEYETAPSDLASFEAKLAPSFVGVECNSKTGIGFAGNYSIGSDDKNNGINSILLTNKALIMPCVNWGSRTVNVYQNEKKFSASILGWGALNSDDFASASTSVVLPNLPLYGFVQPEVGWWVDIAAYVPGFGIKWISSSISLVNVKTLEFLVKITDPILANGGLVFDKYGTFLGVASTATNQSVGYTTIVGAPKQCKPTNASQASATLCTGNGGKAAGPEDIWKPLPKKVEPVAPDPEPTIEPEIVTDEISFETVPNVLLSRKVFDLSDYVSDEHGFELVFESVTPSICDAPQKSSEILLKKMGGCSIKVSAESDDPYVSSPKKAVVTFAIISPRKKKTSITCISGKSTAKISGVKPVCPPGYKKK